MKKTPLLLLLFITASLAIAQTDAPVLPAYFYGDITINGANAPVNTIIYARINADTKGQITVSQVGNYGDPSTDNKLAVIGNRDDQGEIIEFFVKKPNVQEIKADQTFTWQSGSLTVLDLTASGEEIREATQDNDDTTSPSSSGSSSGGGSGGGGAGGSSISIQPQSTDTFTYASIAADQQVSMSPNMGALVRLQLVPSTVLNQVEFSFDAPETIEPQVDNAYSYFTIQAPISDGQVDIAVVRFKIENSWLESVDADTVQLLRLVEGEWKQVSITLEGSDDEHTNYRAGIDGMGSYAITAQPLQIIDDVEEEIESATAQAFDQPDVETNQTQEGNEITGFAIADSQSNILGIIIGVFVVVLIIAGVYFFTRGD